MGAITESFSNLTEHLLGEYKKAKKPSAAVGFFAGQIRNLLPTSIRMGPGTIIDLKERQAGPFDAIATTDNFPPFGQGNASSFLADGVVFTLQIKNWSEHDLTQYGALVKQLKKLDKKRKSEIACLAVSFEPISLSELTSFLGASSGQAVDGVLCLGHHFILRNSLGLYGNPEKVPFVSERSGPEALKAFTFFLLRLSQAALNQPFGLAHYQHL